MDVLIDSMSECRHYSEKELGNFYNLLYDLIHVNAIFTGQIIENSLHTAQKNIASLFSFQPKMIIRIQTIHLLMQFCICETHYTRSRPKQLHLLSVASC